MYDATRRKHRNNTTAGKDSCGDSEREELIAQRKQQVEILVSAGYGVPIYAVDASGGSTHTVTVSHERDIASDTEKYTQSVENGKQKKTLCGIILPVDDHQCVCYFSNGGVVSVDISKFPTLDGSLVLEREFHEYTKGEENIVIVRSHLADALDRIDELFVQREAPSPNRRICYASSKDDPQGVQTMLEQAINVAGKRAQEREMNFWTGITAGNEAVKQITGV